jgi:hypothetical protein
MRACELCALPARVKYCTGCAGTAKINNARERRAAIYAQRHVEDLPGERWAAVNEKYMISDRGRCKSVIHGEKLLAPSPSGNGYNYYPIGRRQMIQAHRLVATAFIGPCPVGLECDHINRQRRDNRVENLRWVTRSENARNRQRN